MELDPNLMELDPHHLVTPHLLFQAELELELVVELVL